MRRLLPTMILAAAVTAALLLTPLAFAETAPDPAKRVVIVLAPYLTWSDVTAETMPNMWGLAEKGAIGDINARSRTREPGERPSPLEGALTISAGAWAVPSFDAPAAFNVDESYEVGNAAEAFRRTTGEQVGDNKIVFLGKPMTDRTNAERDEGVVLGILGEQVEAAGGLTAAIGNSDVGYVTGEQRKVRPAALAAMTESGLVSLGDVSQDLLAENPSAPFGIETDLKRFDAALTSVAEQTAAHKGPSFIVLDPGDTYRATKFETQVAPKVASTQRRHALANLDIIVGKAHEHFPDAVVMIVSQSIGDPRSGRTEGLGPIVVSGDGWDGFLVSDSTQRDGLVTNLDVTATVLSVLGLDRPVAVLGNQMRTTAPEGSIDERVSHLMRMDATAVAVDDSKRAVVNTFVALTVAFLLLSSLVLARSRYWARTSILWWTRSIRVALLLMLSVPVSSWLTFVWRPWPASTTDAVLSLLLTTLVVWLLALALMWKWPTRLPVAVLGLLTTFVLFADQWAGAPLSFTNNFGYSPLLAARFYGLGNEAAAILFGASVVSMALLFDEWPDSTFTKWGKLVGIPVLGVMAIVTSAAPFWGANVGFAIWGTVGFGLAWVMMNGHHVSWRTVLWLFLAAAVVIAGFAVIDLYGGGEQTHLARAIGSAEQGGITELWTIVARNAATNARVLTRTNWSYILIATLAFLAFMRWRPQGDFAESLGRNPDFADAITVCLAAGVVAYFTEDSGIVIPALEFFYMGVGLAWLMLGGLLDATLEGRAPATEDPL